MSVYFRTQQGRTLRNDEMTVDDMTCVVDGPGIVVGYDEQWSRVVDRLTVHVNARHIVEWWEAPSLARENARLGPPWALHSTHPGVAS